MARILIVDDQPDSLESFALLFQNAGHEVTCASDGRKALSFLAKQVPDVILLDLLMPEMDGVSFLKILRSQLGIHELPVVVLTGYPDSPTVARARALIATTILTKGTATPAEILHALEKRVEAFLASRQFPVLQCPKRTGVSRSTFQPRCDSPGSVARTHYGSTIADG